MAKKNKGKPQTQPVNNVVQLRTKTAEEILIERYYQMKNNLEITSNNG